jgi:hypothetical protein
MRVGARVGGGRAGAHRPAWDPRCGAGPALQGRQGTRARRHLPSCSTEAQACAPAGAADRRAPPPARGTARAWEVGRCAPICRRAPRFPQSAASDTAAAIARRIGAAPVAPEGGGDAPASPSDGAWAAPVRAVTETALAVNDEPIMISFKVGTRGEREGEGARGRRAPTPLAPSPLHRTCPSTCPPPAAVGPPSCAA